MTNNILYVLNTSKQYANLDRDNTSQQRVIENTENYYFRFTRNIEEDYVVVHNNRVTDIWPTFGGQT